MHHFVKELLFLTLSMASGLSYMPISRRFSRCDALREDHVKKQSTEGVVPRGRARRSGEEGGEGSVWSAYRQGMQPEGLAEQQMGAGVGRRGCGQAVRK